MCDHPVNEKLSGRASGFTTTMCNRDTAISGKEKASLRVCIWEGYLFLDFFVSFLDFLFFVASGFWLLWLLAFVAFGFCGFWLLWLLAFVAFVASVFWLFGLSIYLSIPIYLSIYFSFFLSFGSCSPFSFCICFSCCFRCRDETKQASKQASKQARAAHLWIWCAAGGGAAPPPTPPRATKSALHPRHPRLPRNQYFKVNSPVQNFLTKQIWLLYLSIYLSIFLSFFLSSIHLSYLI